MIYDPTLQNSEYNGDLAREAYEREAAVDPQAYTKWQWRWREERMSWEQCRAAKVNWHPNMEIRRSPLAPPANPASGKVIERVGEDAGSSRSVQWNNGYRNASKEAITWLHQRANEMNDPHAKAILDSAAFNMGGHFKRTHPAPPSDKVLVRREALEARVANLENENSRILAVLDVLPKVIEGMSIGNVKKEDLPYPKNYWMGSEDAYKKAISTINAHVLPLKSTLAALRSELEGGE